MSPAVESREHRPRLLVALTLAVLALVVGFGAAVDAHASTSAGQVAGTRVAAHDHPDRPVVGVFDDVPAGEGRGTTTPAADDATGSRVAPQTTRGLSPLGGVIEETGTNAAGGRVYTSTGAINQNDFAGIVNSGVMRGDDVHILTGAHGLPNGSIVADAGLLADDVARFGSLPGVRVHDLPSMSPAQIREVLSHPGTIIGGFCDSGACLAPYRRGGAL